MNQLQMINRMLWGDALIVPPILSDGNTWGMFDFTSADNLVKDGSNYVSQVTDLSGSNNHLLQANATNKPLFVDGIVRFDGVNDFMKTATSPLVQPIIIYGVYKLLRWDSTYNAYAWITDSIITGDCSLFDENRFMIWYCGNYGRTNILDRLNVKHNFTALANGANSFIKLLGQTSPAINPGTGAMNGLCLGGRSSLDPIFFTNIEWSGLIIRKIADTTENEAIITNYINTKYGV